MKSRSQWICAGTMCWVLLTFFHQREFLGPTPASRLDVLMALYSECRVCIDSFHQNTPDKALVDGHYYSDKAPGTLAIALLGSLPALRLADLLHFPGDEHTRWLLASWSGCAALNVILAVGFVCMVRMLSGLVKTEFALWTGVFLVFGGVAWPYATMLFSHAHVIGCIAIGMWFLFRALPWRFQAHEHVEPMALTATGHRNLTWAGLAFGIALCSEYTSGLVVVGTCMIVIGMNARAWFSIARGLLWPTLLIPLYSLGTVGSPWSLPYSHQASFPEMRSGLYGIKWPDAHTAILLLVSPERGLLFWCPFLLISIPGYRSLFLANPRVFLLTYCVPAIQVLVFSGLVWDWPAGPTFSARYLAPIFPLMAIPCAIGLERAPWLGMILGGISIALTGIATVTNATPSFELYRNPLFELNAPLFLSRDFNPSVGTVLLGFNDSISLLIFIAMALITLRYLRSGIEGKHL